MSYSYTNELPWLFTDEGQRALLKAYDNAQVLLNSAGAFVGMKALEGVQIGDTFKMMAILDRLVELSRIKEVTGKDVWGQHRIFTRVR